MAAKRVKANVRIAQATRTNERQVLAWIKRKTRAGERVTLSTRIFFGTAWSNALDRLKAKGLVQVVKVNDGWGHSGAYVPTDNGWRSR
jgi:hypothetical protein